MRALCHVMLTRKQAKLDGKRYGERCGRDVVKYFLVGDPFKSMCVVSRCEIHSKEFRFMRGVEHHELSYEEALCAEVQIA